MDRIYNPNIVHLWDIFVDGPAAVKHNDVKDASLFNQEKFMSFTNSEA